MFVSVKGVEQWVTIRGSNLKNPVLLVLHGTGYALSSMAPFFEPWERDFTLVQWDQPGAGATYARDPAASALPLTFDRLVRDGIAVTQFIRQRLQARKIAVLAFSGATIIGLKMVREQPGLFSAYVGSGQVVHWSRQEALCYAIVLGRARAAGDCPAIAELEKIGPPPYKDLESIAVKAKYANIPTPAEQAGLPAIVAAMNRPSGGASYLAPGLAAFDPRELSMATFGKLMNEIVAFDARSLGLEFDVPMFFFQGELDAHLPASEVAAYEADIKAPRKMFVAIPGAGHSAFLRRDEFLALLNRYVRPNTGADLP